MAVRYADCTRRQHRNREASETRYAQTADASLSDFGTGDVSPSNGISLQRQRQRQLQKQQQRQLSLRGTSKATATVAARNIKGNRNCRCAELKATATRIDGQCHATYRHVDRGRSPQPTLNA